MNKNDLKIQHYLNDALRQSLDLMKVKCKEELTYDIGLEYDYNELLKKFLEHLAFVKKANRGV